MSSVNWLARLAFSPLLDFVTFVVCSQRIISRRVWTSQAGKTAAATRVTTTWPTAGARIGGMATIGSSDGVSLPMPPLPPTAQEMLTQGNHAC